MARSTPVPVAPRPRLRRTPERQLAGQVRDRVVAGALPVGAPAAEHPGAGRATSGVSRSVTEQAYDQLAAEGWLESRHGSGTYVAGRRGAPPPPPSGRGPARAGPGCSASTPARRGSTRATGPPGAAPGATSRSRPAPPAYDDPAGLPELRVELAAHLARTRGLTCDPDEILVTTGTIGGLNQVLAALPPGAVAHEDPGYRAAAEAIRASGRDVRDLPAAAARRPTSTGVRRGVRHARRTSTRSAR